MTVLIVHPGNLETPVEQLKCHVYVKLTGYRGDALRAARRVSDRHAPMGHAYLFDDAALQRAREALVVIPPQSEPAHAL